MIRKKNKMKKQMYLMDGNFLALSDESIADAWVSAMQIVFFDGVQIKSQYDVGDDFPTKDVSSAIHVTNPFSKPYSVRGKVRTVKSHENGNIHTVYCHPSDVYCIESIKSDYIEECLDGIKDCEILGGSKSFPYTYHDRIFNYRAVGREDLPYISNKPSGKITIDEGTFKDQVQFKKEGVEIDLELKPVDQIAKVIEKLKDSPYSRRSQVTTWRPYSDLDRGDPPCLQRIWFRIFDGKMRMNTHWRSRDLFGAWEANVNGMLAIGNVVAEKLGVVLTDYFDFCDSLHIYGKKKKLYKEIAPMFERIKVRAEKEKREPFLKPEYNEKLNQLIDEAKVYADKD